MGGAGWMGRLRHGLQQARQGLVGRIQQALGGRRLDAAALQDIEEALLAADLGAAEAERLVDRLRAMTLRTGDAEEVTQALRREIAQDMQGARGTIRWAPEPPTVILLVGVNGSGKTTTAAKLAHHIRASGRSVLLAAADTYRAAAEDQLEVWASRAGVDVVRHAHGGDPAAVVFDAVTAANARGVDAVVCDTAGRLHNKAHLMAELQKVARVAGRAASGAPHECLLVLDAGTGQNALRQAAVFTEAVSVTGLVLAKLDTSARGGTLLAIHRSLGLPVHFVGTGERIEDLLPFDPEAFAAALLSARGE